ncbi:hypothetical protein KKG36_00810, partial [Patescibacteria group bacterium]|nr:hypothetical protein [Patescibacteria group bacterium]
MRKVLIKIAFFLGLILIAGPVLASGTGLVDSTYKYAWSDKMGWINFGCSNCGVAVSGSAVTGYAWSENYGWINLTGVSNDGAGVLSGYAWGEDCGWIDFSGVSINGSGNLVGATTGDAAGIINFSCDNCTVKVDWNASSGGGVVSTGSGPPSGSYSVFIHPSLVNSSIVTLSISANPALPLMAISNTPDFEGVVQEPFSIKRNWDLCPSGCKDTTKAFTVYVKFYNSSGYSPEVISAQVVLDNKAPEIAVSRIKPFKDGEPVVISGSTEAYSDLTFSYYGRYGLSQAGDNGEWKANLGVLPPGDYELVITATDLAKNSATSTVFFTVLA